MKLIRVSRSVLENLIKTFPNIVVHAILNENIDCDDS